jgi:hypothetical protein
VEGDNVKLLDKDDIQFIATVYGQASWSVSFPYDDAILDQCRHEFVDYLGFSESYQYCKKCDKKLE